MCRIVTTMYSKSKTLFVFIVVYLFSGYARGQTDTKHFRDDYTYIEATESFYKIHTTARTFADANRVCALEGASLYYPQNKTESDAVIAFWNKTHPSSDWTVYLGLTDSKTEGVFETVDGKPISEIYANWKPGEPNDKDGREDCAELHRRDILNDVPCNRTYRFICKKSLKSIEWDYSCKMTDFGRQRDKKFFRKDYKYLEAVDSFYKIHTTPKNWRDAKRECALEEASLFYPENSDEANAVISFWKLCQKYTTPSDVWIFVGISDIITEGAFETIDGKSISKVYNHWQLNQPSNSTDEDCLHLNQEGELNDVQCTAKYSFICKKSPPPPEWNCSIDTPKSTLGGHGGKKFFRKDYNYIEAVQSFYKIHKTQRTFNDAKRMCALEGASLFYAENDDEAHAVIEFWNKTHPSGDWTVFVGLSDLMIEGVFETIDGKPISKVYHYWRLGEPNNHGGEEDCVELYRSGYLNDKSCDKKFRFICKKSLQTLQWNLDCNMADSEYTFVKNINKCYKLHSTPLNWMDAYAVCRTEQSYLAVVNNQIETEYLVNLTRSAPKRSVGGSYLRGIYHMGYHNRLNTGWQTVRGAPINTNAVPWWDINALTNDEYMKCGSMFFDGRLNTIDCDTKSFFICEHEIK